MRNRIMLSGIFHSVEKMFSFDISTTSAFQSTMFMVSNSICAFVLPNILSHQIESWNWVCYNLSLKNVQLLNECGDKWNAVKLLCGQRVKEQQDNMRFINIYLILSSQHKARRPFENLSFSNYKYISVCFISNINTVQMIWHIFTSVTFRVRIAKVNTDNTI